MRCDSVKQHGLTREDTDCGLAVESHLTMSSTAQKQDCRIRMLWCFAAKMKNDRYLVALYLLTVADIRGTSARYERLERQATGRPVLATRRYMTGGKIADQVGEIRQRAVETLSLYAIAPEKYELLWRNLMQITSSPRTT